MVRPTQLLNPPLPPVTPRPASTLLLLRDADTGLEVLMTRRSRQAGVFAAGMHVFPGGSIDRSDALVHDQVLHRPAQQGEPLTQAIAALRESFEELGILLARHADGRPADADDIAALDRQAPLMEQCAARGLRLACDQTWPMANWITPVGAPKRFDVAFLVARMPENQEALADETEQFEPVWLRPADALERHKAKTLELMFPTRRTLQYLLQHDSVDAVLAACSPRDGVEEPLWSYQPRAAVMNGKPTRIVNDEPAYGELELVDPDGQQPPELAWQHTQAVPLLRNLQRLTCGNGGTMTGPGTNSYLVGDAATGFIAIDPGPDDAAHLQRLFDAAGGDIRQIVCTHSHADHSPGARPLQALCVAAGRAAPPVLGLPSAPTANAASQFVPDRALADGERLVLVSADGAATHTLRVVCTPGHAANHLCLVLEEDGLLFSGDHVLNGSTTIVNPPDGHMTAYLDSLDRLSAACLQGDIRFILPAHGHVLGDAAGAIAKLKAHRLAREARVAAAMAAEPGGDIQSWVRLAYADVPPALWPIAARSLTAHVDRLRELAAH